MKSYYRNILLASAALLAAAACTKTVPEGQQVQPMPITISAVDGLTKAMLDEYTFKADGNRIQVYAYAGGDYYFSDLIGPEVTGSSAAEATDGVWPFVNGPHQWTVGEHRFYGWLANDANGTEDVTTDDLSPVSIFGNTFACVTGTDKNVTVAAFDPDSQILTIPVTDMNQNAPQFDFMYSNIYTTEPINEPVKLEFSHLFAAYYFSFTNDSAEPLYLENVSLNAKTSASASLDFSSSSPAVTVNFQGTQTSIEKIYNTNVGAGETIDVLLTGNAIDSPTEIPDDSYRLIWPQDLSDASVNIVFTAKVTPIIYTYNAKGGPYNVDKAENVGAGKGDYNLVSGHYEYAGKGKGSYNVTFKHDARGVYIESVGNPEELDVSKSIPLSSVTSDGKWIGGKKYNYNLSFSNDFIDLELVVMKWDGGHGGSVSFN